jgi:hypothetical protein
MGIFVALAVGYIVGSKTGGKELEHLGRSLKALCETDEFADVVTAVRSQLGSSLRELATMVDSAGEMTEVDGDLIARVRSLVARDGPSDFTPRSGGRGPAGPR